MIYVHYEVHKNGKLEYSDFDRSKVEKEYLKLISKNTNDNIIIVRVCTASDIIRYNKQNK